MPVKVMRLEGERFELALEDSLFPKALKSIPQMCIRDSCSTMGGESGEALPIHRLAPSTKGIP